MAVAEIVVFAVSWLVVTSLMLWGVFTERRRGPAVPAEAPARHTLVAHTDWVVLETTPGSAPDDQARARLVAAALLASRGVDIDQLPAGDLRTEVTTDGDGASSTRILVRAGAMHASRRRR